MCPLSLSHANPVGACAERAVGGSGGPNPRAPLTIAVREHHRCADDVWVAVSTSTESVARRVLALIGVGGDERFGTFASRMEHRDELEGALAGWIAARPSADVLAAFEVAHAAAAPVYTMADLARDPHVRERDVLTDVGGVVMPGPVARLSRTPGRITGPGRPLGADTDEVLSETARPEEVE